MTILATVYASAPDSEVLVPTIELSSAAFATPIRICTGFEDHAFTLENSETVTFEASGLDVALPKRDTSGQQNLTFAIDNVTGTAQAVLDHAIEENEQITLTYRLYLASQPEAPAEKPLTMIVVGAQMNASSVQVTCSFRDILGRTWPRERYTAQFAPGLRYQ